MTKCEICNKKISQLKYKSYILPVCSVECLGKYLKEIPKLHKFQNQFNVSVNFLRKNFKSELEEEVAYYLKKQGIKFYYEPYIFQYNSTVYIPDFFIPEKNLFLEIKGKHKLNIYKFLTFATLCKNFKMFIPF